jgi:peptidoglycan/xylan/chitin deacetylase (PgdA/CDA1 family)
VDREPTPSRRSVGAGLGAAWLAPMRAKGAEGLAWPGGAKAAVSLTYDDALDSQITNAAPALAEAGFKATFFLTKDNISPRALDDWVRVARAGHEIGNHTVSHPCGLQSYSPAAFARDELIPMQHWLDLNFGLSDRRLYAYPCSVTDLGPGGPNAQLARYEGLLRSIGFRAARDCDGDAPNSVAHARAHPYRLRANAVTYEADDPTVAIDYVRQAMATGAWAILVFHDIVQTRVGEGDASIRTHRAVLAWLQRQHVWCAPMGQVLDTVTTISTRT